MNWIGGARSRAQQQQQTGGFYNQNRGRGGVGGYQGSNYQRAGGSRGSGRRTRGSGSDRPRIERRANVGEAGQGVRVGTFRGRRHVYYNAARHERLFDLSCRDDDKKYSPLLDFIDRTGFPRGPSLRLQLSHELEINRCTGNGNTTGAGDHHHNDHDMDTNTSFLTDDMFSDDDISLFTSDMDVEEERPVPRKWSQSQDKIQMEMEQKQGHDPFVSSPTSSGVLSSTTSCHDCMDGGSTVRRTIRND